LFVCAIAAPPHNNAADEINAQQLSLHLNFFLPEYLFIISKGLTALIVSSHDFLRPRVQYRLERKLSFAPLQMPVTQRSNPNFLKAATYRWTGNPFLLQGSGTGIPPVILLYDSSRLSLVTDKCPLPRL
jgi:hypothetical protein